MTTDDPQSSSFFGDSNTEEPGAHLGQGSGPGLWDHRMLGSQL